MQNTNVAVKQDHSPVARLKRVLNADSVQQQFKNALHENSGLFIASLIDLYANDQYLQKCEPNDVIMEALKAATLKLPINKSLGFAYIVPFKNNKLQRYDPTMIIGYKGYLQLAQRTGQYKFINADVVFEGESVDLDRLTGQVFFTGEPTSEKAIGYFAHIETINGFRKTVFWTKQRVDEHAKKYSKSYHHEYGNWKKEFDSMAIKTVLRHLLTRYGVMSVEMIGAIDIERGDIREQLPEPIEQRPRVAYDVTAKAPPKEPAKNEPGPAETSASPEPKPAEKSVTEHPSEKPTVDQFGTPLDNPFEKTKWFHMRAGTPSSGTGFAVYVHTYRDSITDTSNATYGAMCQKFKKFYSKPFPYLKNGDIRPLTDDSENFLIGDNEQDENDGDLFEQNSVRTEEQKNGRTEESQNDTESILNSEAAKTLAMMANDHKREYIMVVRNRTPDSIEQIYDWISQINGLVIEHKRNPPIDESDKF